MRPDLYPRAGALLTVESVAWYSHMRSSRDAGDHKVIINRRGHQRTAANHAPRSNRALWQHRRADADQRSFADHNAAAKGGTRCNVGMGADAVMMLNNAATVENNVHADVRARIHHGARSNNRSRADDGITRNNCRWMTRNRELLAARGQTGTELEFVIMVIAVSCVKLLSAHNSTQHTSRKHKV
jgi:hypothetical protein